jgi:dTDP-4-dehydrorhamnose 3,5-epimerase
MLVEETALSDVLILTPRRFGDARGWFLETHSDQAFDRAGISTRFVQDNHSMSAQAGTLRGLHYQRPPMAQAKLVRCTRGAIRDIAVDFRRDSPQFGQWVVVELSAENDKQLLIPAGFLHGFVTLTDDCQVQYKCSAPYAPECDAGIRWDDPTLAIDWGVTEPILSDKDRIQPLWSDVTSPFTVTA